jgi:5-methylcytosine-specific restriction endonuclease McrA
MSEWYDEYLKSNVWQRTRLKRLLRANLDDDFNVIQCDREECKMWFPLGLVEVHHTTYKRVGRERMSDLEVLCGSCHGVRHGHPPEEWWRYLKSKNARMVTVQSYRKLRQLEHISHVVDRCLQRRDYALAK